MSRKIWIQKLNKGAGAYKEVPEYEDLNELQKEVLELCQRSDIAINSNTSLCKEFWFRKTGYSEDVYDLLDTIELYPPENLTRIRRTLTEAELIHPKKEIQEKREEIEKSYHNTPQVAMFEQDAKPKYNFMTGEKL